MYTFLSLWLVTKIRPSGVFVITLGLDKQVIIIILTNNLNTSPLLQIPRKEDIFHLFGPISGQSRSLAQLTSL